MFYGYLGISLNKMNIGQMVTPVGSISHRFSCFAQLPVKESWMSCYTKADPNNTEIIWKSTALTAHSERIRWQTKQGLVMWILLMSPCEQHIGIVCTSISPHGVTLPCVETLFHRKLGQPRSEISDDSVGFFLLLSFFSRLHTRPLVHSTG